VAVIVDSSALIAYLRGEPIPLVDAASKDGTIVVPPLVVAELVTGGETPAERAAIGELIQDSPLHPTPLAHWIAVGELRRTLRRAGLAVTIPDAHIAQCALDRDAVLLTRDKIFRRMARHIALRLAE
jgi:predicted nucleic acid-binding protein